MNTTKKGDQLEKQIYSLLKREIVKGQFLAQSGCCRIFSKKGYYSRDREKDIIFDISVEIYLPGQSDYSILVLVECKNYNHSVPPDDAEEFFAKIQQVSGGNVKGIIVSTNSFQDGTVRYSSSKGIGLLRYYNKDKIKWELLRSPSALVSFSYAASKWETARKGLLTESYVSRYFDCYCFSDGNFTISLRAFFSRLLIEGTDEENKNKLVKVLNKPDDNRWLVKYRDALKIEEISQGILKRIGYTHGEVPLESICKLEAEESNLSLIYEAVKPGNQADDMLGSIIFKPLQITIYRSADYAKEREKFTLAHELGHYFLSHSRYMSGEYLDGADLEVENPPELGVKDIMRMEWQANYFASCLLLPERQFIADFLSVAESFGLKDRGFGLLYLDEQACNLQSFFYVTGVLKEKYKVSREVVKLRLKRMGFLNEHTIEKAGQTN
jgi:Zn-dependent peptidase ImmA (M78 family)